MGLLSTPRRIQGWAAALAAALLGLTAWSALEARRTALDQAAVGSRNLARTLELHTAQAFQTIDQTLADLAERLSPADPSAAAAALARAPVAGGAIRALTLLDSHGARLAAAGAPDGGADEVDIAFLEALRGPAEGGLQIGPPLRRQTDGNWVVPVSRRLGGPRGAFAGLLVATLDTGYFRQLYDRLEIGSHGSLALLRTDGTLYFRRPYDAATFGLNQSDRPVIRDHLLREPAGTHEDVSAIDGVERIVSHRRLERYPFVVMTGLAKDDVLAGWRRQAALHLAAGCGLALGVLGLGALLARETRRRGIAEAEARCGADQRQRERLLLDAMLTALPDGVALLDAQGAMLLWNDQLADMLDLERAAFADKPDAAAALAQLLAARGDGALAPGAATAAPIGISVEEARLATGKWIERWMIRRNGGAVVLYRDIAERKRRETAAAERQERLGAQTAALARLTDDLDRARQMAEAARVEAETASRTKSSFITGMNHELRTPLNAILGFAQIIRDQRFGTNALPRYSEYAGHIISSGEHLLALINDLLDLAKIEAGKMDLQAQPVDLKQLLASTVLMVKETAASGKVAIETAIPDEPLTLAGDPRRLKQCFLNLLSNAVKFTPAGGRVVISARQARDAVEVSIADTGIGVKPSDIEKIFEPFGQIDSPLARRHVGTGLGLPLARNLVEMHGGDLIFRSVEGAGTTVTVSLPRRRLVA